jgi:N6-adenosine-specific RNA methylase IME4
MCKIHMSKYVHVFSKYRNATPNNLKKWSIYWRVIESNLLFKLPIEEVQDTHSIILLMRRGKYN